MQTYILIFIPILFLNSSHIPHPYLFQTLFIVHYYYYFLLFIIIINIITTYQVQFVVPKYSRGGSISWNMVDLSGATTLKKADFSSPGSHQ